MPVVVQIEIWLFCVGGPLANITYNCFALLCFALLYYQSSQSCQVSLCSYVLNAVNGLAAVVEKHVTQTDTISEDIHDCGLGIDAHHYLRQLYLRKPIKTSISAAIGGIPTAFRSEIERDLNHFRKLNVDVKFIFDGLDLFNFNLKDKKAWRTDVSVAARHNAWDAWQKLAEKGRYADGPDREKLAKQARDAFEIGSS